MDPRYHGAPGWGGQYDDAQSRGSQLPTSKAGPSGRPGPPAPQPGYSGAPQYHPSPQAYGSNGPLPAGSVPAYPSGQYPAQQRSGPPSNSQGGYHGYAPPGPSGPASGSMGGFNPYGPPPGGAYGQPPPGGPSMASMLNPFSMISSVSQMGNNMQASQQYVSSRVSWYTGAFFGQLFQVDTDYVQRKLRLLLMPYLRHYAYLRQAENMATSAPQMKPPREDLYAPDLYVPLHAMCTYVVLSAWNRFFAGPFAPEVMYNMFTWASMAWAVNFAVIWVLVRLMQLASPPPALEIFAFAGYSFVGYSVAIVMGWALGRSLGWYSAWLYTSMCMAIFLIRSFKQVIRIDAAPRGKSVMYLLLVIASFQFVLSWVMGATIHPHATAAAVASVAPKVTLPPPVPP